MLESTPPTYSVVVPFYNEEEALLPLLGEITAAMDSLEQPYEVVAVDDGSADATPPLLARAAAQDPRIRTLLCRQNRGQAAALYMGLRAARGAVMITMDGDGQNDPADIPRLLQGLGYADMVVGIRARRKDSWLRRFMSRWANRIRGKLLKDGMTDSGCALKVFRQEIVAALLPIRTLYSFLPALAVAAGYRVSQMPVAHRPRHGGTSSYGLRAFLIWPTVDLFGLWWFGRRTFLADLRLKANAQRVSVREDARPSPESLPLRGTPAALS